MADNKKHKFKISLCNKIILLIIITLMACTSLWTLVMFFNMSNNAKDVAMTTETTYINNINTQLEEVEKTCYLVQQVILQKNSIIDYIEKVQNNEDLDTVEKIDFYDKEIDSIAYMVNINPYIANVRLFVNADITEKQPSFYNINRLKKLSWGNTYKNNEWIIDYSDTLYSTAKGSTHLAGIVSEIRDDSGKLLALLEVSTNLNDLFADFYNQQDNEFCCFVSEDGTIYADDKYKDVIAQNKQDILKLAKTKSSNVSTTDFDDQTSIISSLPVTSLNGVYIHATGIDNIISSYIESQSLYFIVVLISTIIFIIIVVFLIKSSFSRFTNLTNEVNSIKDGKFIKLTETGNDEISELGRQINNMLSSLEKLNTENTQKQLLAKNAEIRSLQNQINAHFMYNVLETIKMMAEIKGDYDISDAVTSLGNMFRYSMQWSSGMVELSEEVKNIKNYLELMNLRQDYEIYLSLNIPSQLMSIKIPKMSLQPLVENSVYHGIENMAEDTSIYIKGFVKNNVATIEVSDAGVGMSEEKLQQLREKINSVDNIDESKEHGRALYNVQQRIKMYFGSEYGLSIYSQEGAFTKVSIQIPLDKEKHK